MTPGLQRFISSARPQKGRSGGSGGGGGGNSNNALPLPQGVSVRRQGTNAAYNFEQDGNRVSMQIMDVLGEHIVDFSVNGRFVSAGSTGLSPAQGANIARKVGAIMKHDASTRPNGFLYSTSAVVGDGLGASRAALYGRAGFSFPSRPGATQFATIRAGKLVPSDLTGKALSKSERERQAKAVREALRAAARARRQSRS